MIARLFYLVILKMGYLLFFSGGNEIRHFIALLRSYRGTLYRIADRPAVVDPWCQVIGMGMVGRIEQQLSFDI